MTLKLTQLFYLIANSRPYRITESMNTSRHPLFNPILISNIHHPHSTRIVGTRVCRSFFNLVCSLYELVALSSYETDLSHSSNASSNTNSRTVQANKTLNSDMTSPWAMQFLGPYSNGLHAPFTSYSS